MKKKRCKWCEKAKKESKVIHQDGRTIYYSPSYIHLCPNVKGPTRKEAMESLNKIKGAQ